MIYDYIIVGGGIVGLSVAMRLIERHPAASIRLFEKEDSLGFHQTGHNSGVIHAGIYYKPGSLKARLCREGSIALKQFCTEHSIPFDECGKLVVATDEVERARLRQLTKQARDNDIEVHELSAYELSAIEPSIVGCAALLVPRTAIVDYRLVCKSIADILTKSARVELCLGQEVVAIEEATDVITVDTHASRCVGRMLIACAGLQSDRVARLARLPIAHRIVPFRGEYYRLRPAAASAIRHLIYPVPDPALPFLGIHLTRMIGGHVTVGPNAILGLAREGYLGKAPCLRDLQSMASFPGFWRLLGKYWRPGLRELHNSFSKAAYLQECRKYCPSLRLDDLEPSVAGIRAQAVLADGSLEHDFLFAESPRSLHVCNAPSPAATSSLAIADMIADRVLAATRRPRLVAELKSD